jgi:hypothetical protein
VVDDILFEVLTPLNFTVRTTKQYWDAISTIKHPAMKGKVEIVKRTLQMPDEIRQSRSDDAVFLFYRAESFQRWTCAVTKRVESDGFLITAYPSDSVKEGKQVWKR